MSEVRTKPPPGSAPPGLLRFGIGAVVVGIAAGTVGVLGIGNVLELSTNKKVGGVVFAALAVPLGIAAIVAWVKLRQRKGVPRTEWHPPQDPWQQRFESSRAVTALLAAGWVWFLIGTVRLMTRPMTDEVVVSLVGGVGLVLLLTSALVTRWRRRRQPASRSESCSGPRLHG